jgi:CheY-like chemotaxis protein
MPIERNFGVLLLSGGFFQWSTTITPFFLSRTDCLSIVETVDELLSLQSVTRPEMIVICHCPGVFDGIGAARQIREIFPVTPLVLLAIANIDTLKDALALGALAVLEPPFTGEAVTTAIDRCRRLAGALKEEALQRTGNDFKRDFSMPSLPDMPDLYQDMQKTPLPPDPFIPQRVLPSREVGFAEEKVLKSTVNVSGNDIEMSAFASFADSMNVAQPEPVATPVVEISSVISPNENISSVIPPAAVIPPAHDNSAALLQSLKVLVAEDVPMLQIAIKHLLESLGCQFVVVGNGKEALDELEKSTFDVVLMDIRMPVMDGFETTRLIRQKEQTTGGRIPVVALSSYSLNEIKDKCIEIGMDTYLVKPVDKKKLVETLLWIINPQEVSEQSESLSSSLNGLPVLDARSVLENTGFDLELYWELIDIYNSTYVRATEELAELLAEADLKVLLEAAHSLKGAVSSIGGKRMEEVARQIQTICGEGKRPVVKVWAPIVRAESAALIAAMETIGWDDLRKFVTENG